MGAKLLAQPIGMSPLALAMSSSMACARDSITTCMAPAGSFTTGSHWSLNPSISTSNSSAGCKSTSRCATSACTHSVLSIWASVLRAALPYRARASSATEGIPPIPDSQGIERTSEAQNESMVLMLRRAGCASKFQPFSRSRRKAARASCQLFFWCAVSGSSSCKPSASFFNTRACISDAALRVKVMARISSGRFTVANKARIRSVSNSVLPEPAGA